MGTVAWKSSARGCFSKRLIRYGLALLGTAAAVGCSDHSIPTGSTRPPPEPSYSLTLTSPTLSGAQGTSTSFITVRLNRIAFTGNVALSVENLPIGVRAFFSPASPVTGSFSELWMSVGEESPIGTFTNLLVRGVASGMLDRTAPLTLRITAAPRVSPFAVLTLSSATLSIMQGTATPTTTVNVERIDYTGPVTLWTDIGDFHGTMPPGVTAAFAPNPTTGNSSVLTLSVSAAAVPGVYDLWIYAEAERSYVEGPQLWLTVTAAPPPPPLVFSTVQGSIGLHACGLERLTQLAYCWGDNGSGALGSGQTSGSPFPRW